MRSQPRRAFCAGAFLIDFLAGYPVLPIHRSILSRSHPLPTPGLPTSSSRNVTNAPANIVRMERGKIVTHYNMEDYSRMTRDDVLRGIGDVLQSDKAEKYILRLRDITD